MAGQKIENLLNLALDTTQEEREKSLELDVGYDPIEREWDVIVKYSGSLDNIRALASGVTELLNEYAIVTVKESRLAGLAALTEVEYIEKPKRLFFQTADAPLSFWTGDTGGCHRLRDRLYAAGFPG